MEQDQKHRALNRKELRYYTKIKRQPGVVHCQGDEVQKLWIPAKSYQRQLLPSFAVDVKTFLLFLFKKTRF